MFIEHYSLGRREKKISVEFKKPYSILISPNGYYKTTILKDLYAYHIGYGSAFVSEESSGMNLPPIYISDNKIHEGNWLTEQWMKFAQLPEDPRLKLDRIHFDCYEMIFYNSNGSVRQLRDMSFGQRRLALILAKLASTLNDKTLVLIDEPENGLHIEWQNTLSDIFESYCELTGNQIVIATHSPNFVGTHLDNVCEIQIS